MGFSSADDYNNAATDFMNSDGSDVESFTDSSGTVYKYNSVTHEFCMAKSDGTVITYFIPDNPDEYWEGQVVKNDNDF
jgi:pyocin large subunit-like protein